MMAAGRCGAKQTVRVAEGNPVFKQGLVEQSPKRPLLLRKLLQLFLVGANTNTLHSAELNRLSVGAFNFQQD